MLSNVTYKLWLIQKYRYIRLILLIRVKEKPKLRFSHINYNQWIKVMSLFHVCMQTNNTIIINETTTYYEIYNTHLYCLIAFKIFKWCLLNGIIFNNCLRQYRLYRVYNQCYSRCITKLENKFSMYDFWVKCFDYTYTYLCLFIQFSKLSVVQKLCLSEAQLWNFKQKFIY